MLKDKALNEGQTKGNVKPTGGHPRNIVLPIPPKHLKDKGIKG
ncbi:MAG TPA: hypothetical protein VK559_02630 [Ferruginibacter sp.]|nr:hypothetical protein [Ferruginibacter sp.]